MLTNLEKVTSLSHVDISGDDSLRTFLCCDSSGKTELNSSCFPFLANIGELCSRRMFPSDKDLLKIDLGKRES